MPPNLSLLSTVLVVTPEVIRKIPVLQNLAEPEIERLLLDPYNTVTELGPYQPIFAENDPADCMYLVLEGTIDVRINSVDGRQISIATLKEGEYFGEQAVLPGASGRRNASVRSLGRCKIMRISAEYVAAGAVKSDEFLASGQEHESDSDDRVRTILRTVRLFRSLSSRDLERVNEWTKIVRFAAGDIVLREGDIGEFLYVVLDGELEVFAMDDDGKIVVISRHTKGQYVGEGALLPGGSTRHDLNVRAATNATLVRVARRHFQAIVKHDAKLLAALKVLGEAREQKKLEAIGRGENW